MDFLWDSVLHLISSPTPTVRFLSHSFSSILQSLLLPLSVCPPDPPLYMLPSICSPTIQLPTPPLVLLLSSFSSMYFFTFSLPQPFSSILNDPSNSPLLLILPSVSFILMQHFPSISILYYKSPTPPTTSIPPTSSSSSSFL